MAREPKIFSDSGLGPIQSSLRGMCIDAVDLYISLCATTRWFASRLSTLPVFPPQGGHRRRQARVTAKGVSPKARISPCTRCTGRIEGWCRHPLHVRGRRPAAATIPLRCRLALCVRAFSLCSQEATMDRCRPRTVVSTWMTTIGASTVNQLLHTSLYLGQWQRLI
jgi:hypothetical protein